MTTETIETRTHPTSGEAYAVRVLDGRIIEAAGPMRYDDADPEGWLANAEASEASEDAAWLAEALGEPGPTEPWS